MPSTRRASGSIQGARLTIEEIDGRGERALSAAAALSRHGTGDLVRLTGLTDDEILALNGADSASEFDLPWISARESMNPSFSRDEARLGALRSLILRGHILHEGTMSTIEKREPLDDATAYMPDALMTGILTRRALSPRTVRVADTLDEATTVLRLFIDTDGTVLHELITPDGLHHFFMSDLPHAGTAVLHRVDPSRRTPGESAEEGIFHGDMATLAADDRFAPVIANAAPSSQIIVTERASRVSEEYRVAVSDAGTAVLRPSMSDEDVEAIQVSLPELTSMLEELIQPAPPIA